MILLGFKKGDWSTVQKQVLNDVPGFIKSLKEYNKEGMSRDLRNRLKVKVNAPEFDIK